MLETLCVMKESILYNNIFNLKTDVHNTKYLTCTYKMCPRERWYQSSLIDTHSGVFNCFWKYVINTKAIGRHIDLKLNWIALMMKLNWVCVDDQPFWVLLSNSISNSLPIIIYVFTSLMFGTCASRRWRSSLEFAKLMSLQCKRMRHKHHSTLSTPTPKLKVYDISS